MTLTRKLICAIRGAESILFVLPREAGEELDFKNDDILEFVVKNGTLIISKIDHENKQFSREGDDEK
jgi:antitoxin component of MazEF toxin-antitoxin module